MKAILSFLVLAPILIFGQIPSEQKVKKHIASEEHLTLPVWNKVMNRSFLSILGANSNNTTIGNYASFDPVEGSFTFKGSMAFGKESTKRVSYLGLTLNGDLISQSYATLFSNTKLNADAGIQADYHFRLGRNRFVTNRASEGEYMFKRRLLDSLRFSEFDKVKADFYLSKERLTLADRQQKVLTGQLLNLRKNINEVEVLTAATFLKKPLVQADAKRWTDSLVSLIVKKNALLTDSISTKIRFDSLANTIQFWQGLSDARDYANEIDLQKALDSLDAKYKLDAVTFNWFTVVAGTGRKNYYTFHDSLPLPSQLTKLDITTWRLGVAWNLFWQDLFLNRSVYLNVGVFRQEGNNATLLSTTSVNQERVFKNASGDTTRKVVNKYDVYEEPITGSKQWQFYANFYYLLGTRTSGLHIFPSFISTDHARSYGNMGVGYVISFINNKKEHPLINAEGYIQFVDVLNQTNSEFDFLERNEIGVRFALPIALLTK